MLNARGHPIIECFNMLNVHAAFIAAVLLRH